MMLAARGWVIGRQELLARRDVLQAGRQDPE